MRYGEKVAVDDLDLTVDRHTITAVLGPNGAGKTTTLETCEGYRKPQQGSVSVLGLDPQRQRRDLLPRIGVMLQDGGAWSGVRAMEMLAPHRPAARRPARRRRARRTARTRRLRSHPLPTALRRPAAAAQAGDGDRRPAGAGVRGRADGGDGPAGRRTTWELLATAAHRRRDRRAHHAPHGRGRAARRPDPHHRPRPDDRLRHAARADPRRHLHDPAGGHQAVPRRRARVAAAARSATASR